MDLFINDILQLTEITVQWVEPGKKFGPEELDTNTTDLPILGFWHNDSRVIGKIEIFESHKHMTDYLSYARSRHVYSDYSHILMGDVINTKDIIERDTEVIMGRWDLVKYVRWMYYHLNLYLNVEIPKIRIAESGIMCRFMMISMVDNSKVPESSLLLSGRVDRLSVVSEAEAFGHDSIQSPTISVVVEPEKNKCCIIV